MLDYPAAYESSTGVEVQISAKFQLDDYSWTGSYNTILTFMKGEQVNISSPFTIYEIQYNTKKIMYISDKKFLVLKPSEGHDKKYIYLPLEQ